MGVHIRLPWADVLLKFVLTAVVLTVANVLYTLYTYFWEIILTAAAVAVLGLILDWLVLPNMGSFPSLYVDKMGYLIVISLLSLGLSDSTIVPFYVAELIAILLAVFEEFMHRMVLPRERRLPDGHLA
ncbi:DUF2512 family protein [Alicyclobacillus ferrooxydans]|uniref:Uncharacterized protein n=1 Tax=Alicyclobacillus ferrooxydans TaxID=471514 RepID=A0A0N8PNM9_9BACL|nr:DUF2512 family protein [Alicyclobacillus ferrooxydans]KPV41973.1 hypothetical protein AN477_19545 [Alicyclobacillus ferrooxydans]